MKSWRLSAASPFLLVILSFSCSEAKLPFGLHGWVTDNTLRHATGFSAFVAGCWVNCKPTCQYAHVNTPTRLVGLKVHQTGSAFHWPRVPVDCTSCFDSLLRGHHFKDRHASKANDSSAQAEEIILSAETGTAGKIYPPRLVDEIKREREEVSAQAMLLLLSRSS